MKKFVTKNKEAVILTAAIIMPFGLMALGAWKAVELYKKSKENKEDDKQDSVK